MFQLKMYRITPEGESAYQMLVEAIFEGKILAEYGARHMIETFRDVEDGHSVFATDARLLERMGWIEEV